MDNLKNMKRILIIALMVCSSVKGWAQADSFCIAKDGKTATIVVDVDDWKGVIRAARNLSDDVRKVTGVSSQVDLQSPHSAGLLPHERQNLKGSILVGTIGKSRIIEDLIRQKKIDVRKVRDQWESYLIDVVDGNLVIAGSDKRGTIYGIYDLSERDYQQTLLHEMIHYYIAYTSVRDTSAHGRLFRQEAARINHAGGWNITISERRRTLTVRKEHQRKQSLLLLLKTEDGKFYVSAVNPNYRTIIDRQARMAKVIEEYHWTVSGDSRYSTLPLSRSLRGRRISESEYLQIILNS